MKIALTLFNKEEKPMLVVEFGDYYELRDYWKKRRATLPKYVVARVDEADLPSMRAVCVGLTPKVGDGWRVLGPYENVEDGDQWWASTTGKWEDTRCAGQRPAPTTTYRRPAAGVGWCFLERGDTLKSGDEYLFNDKWIPTALLGSVIGKYGKDGAGPLRYRRKVDTPGYVLLHAEDRLEEGDVYKSSDGWKPVRSTGIPVGGAVGYFARPVNGLTPESNGATC